MEIIDIIIIILFISLIFLLVINFSLRIIYKKIRLKKTKELHLLIKNSEMIIKNENYYSEKELRKIKIILEELKKFRKEFLIYQKQWLNTSAFKYIKRERKAKVLMNKLNSVILK